MQQNPAFRSSLAPRLIEESLAGRRVQDEYAHMLSLLRDFDALDIIKSKLLDDPVRKKGLFDDQLLQIEKVREIGLDSLVGVRPTEMFRIAEANGTVTLSFQNKVIEFPSFVSPQLRSLQRHPRTLVSQLPSGLDAEGKLVLVRRLVSEGLLQVYETSPSSRGDSSIV